jgi:RNA polymerase sigma-70 factor (ECF subfamily)
VDSEQFALFYERTCSSLVGLLTSIGGDRAEAEEVAQDAYIKVIQRWSEVSQYDAPEAWLRTVAVRLLISRKRRVKAWLRASVRHASGAERHAREPNADRVAVAQALEHLSVAQRSVLMLHHGLDLPVDEVAALLQVPVGTVKSRLARARETLAPLLSDEEVRDHEPR